MISLLSVAFAFLIVAAVCLWNYSSLSPITPRFFYSVLVYAHSFCILSIYSYDSHDFAFALIEG